MDIVGQDARLIATHYNAHSERGIIGRAMMNSWTLGFGALVGSIAFCRVVFGRMGPDTKTSTAILGWDKLLYDALSGAFIAQAFAANISIGIPDVLHCGI
jgi:hypothetical protein